MSPDDPELSVHIRRHATRHTAPDPLRAGIRAQVALAEAGRATPTGAGRKEPWWRRWLVSPRLTAVAGFAAGLVFAAVVAPILPALGPEEPVEVRLVVDHVRALRVGPLTEVVSTDRHTVKPWFQGKVDYAPPVFDLAAEGFPLQGGRIERVRGQAIATLTYTRDRHVIDLFVWPGSARQVPMPSVQRGFNLLHWADGSMEYWIVSDVERAEVERFARVWQSRVAVP